MIWDSGQCSSATLYMSRRTWHAIKAVQWPSFRLCAGHKSRYTSKIVGQTQLLSYIYRTYSTSSYFSICCKFWLKCSTINWHSTKKELHMFFPLPHYTTKLEQNTYIPNTYFHWHLSGFQLWFPAIKRFLTFLLFIISGLGI